MPEYTVEQVRELIGLQKVPRSGGIPAAWWISTDPEQLAAWDRWAADYRAHVDKVEELAKTLGMTAGDAYMNSWGKKGYLTGFRVPLRMGFHPGHPENIPVPSGWRINKKTDRLVPSRKTKADRESQANKDFAAVKNVPDVHAYLSGMFDELYIDDRGFGGTVYRTQFNRGEHCVWAYCGGDPDRSPDVARFGADGTYDQSIWHRQKLSVLVALMEQAREAKAAEEALVDG